MRLIKLKARSCRNVICRSLCLLIVSVFLAVLFEITLGQSSLVQHFDAFLGNMCFGHLTAF